MKKYKYIFYGVLNIIIVGFVILKYKNLTVTSLNQILIIASYIILTNFLFLISYVDYKEKIISNKYILTLLIIRVLLISVELIIVKSQVHYTILQYTLGAIVGGLIFLLPRFFVKNSVGMGDVKLVSIVGFYLGIDKIITIIIVSLFMSLIYFFIMFILKKFSKEKLVAYAPFITLSFIICTILNI